MQENALHGWRLSDGQHMRMSGYPSKTTTLSFSRNGKWLATSGADAMVLWPFFGGGPMGKAPMELAGGDGVLCQQVACNPQRRHGGRRIRRRAGGGDRYRVLPRVAGGAARARAGFRPGLELRTAASSPSAPRAGSPRSSICRAEPDGGRMFGPVSGEDMRAAQIITGAAMALWLSIGFVPGLRRHAMQLQVGVLVLYLVGCAAIFAHAMLR